MVGLHISVLVRLFVTISFIFVIDMFVCLPMRHFKTRYSHRFCNGYEYHLHSYCPCPCHTRPLNISRWTWMIPVKKSCSSIESKHWIQGPQRCNNAAQRCVPEGLGPRVSAQRSWSGGTWKALGVRSCRISAKLSFSIAPISSMLSKLRPKWSWFSMCHCLDEKADMWNMWNPSSPKNGRWNVNISLT